MAVEIKDLSSGNTLAINSDGEASVALTRTVANAGFAALAAEVHSGLSGPSRIVRKANISPNGYLRVGLDNLVWRDVFNHAIVQNDAYQVSLTTMTVAVSGGYMVFNSGNSLANAAVARVQTYRTFELFGFGTLMGVFRVRFAISAQADNVCEIGFGIAATTATPTDGVYFKLSATGALLGVINVNGIEVTTPLVTSIVANTVYELRVRVDEDEVNFFVNGTLEGVLNRDAASAGPAFARCWPILMRLYNSAVVSTSQRLEVAEVTVFQTDIPFYRTPGAIAVSGCNHASNNIRGVAVGQTANYTNSTEPVNATLSNTAAGYTTLGGQWAFAAVAGAVTDYALFAYSTATPTAATSNKNLWITGISIDTVVVGAAIATTATVLQWALGVGSSAVSLATADGTGLRGPRRIPLGVQGFVVGAAIGTVGTRIEVAFAQPILVEAGTFAHIILRVPVGTATGSQVFRGIVRIDGYFE